MLCCPAQAIGPKDRLDCADTVMTGYCRNNSYSEDLRNWVL